MTTDAKTLNGVYTAIVTPLQNDKSVDFETFEKLVDEQIRAEISGLVPIGSTGEASTLNLEEKKQIVQICIDKAKKITDSNKRFMPVIPGASSNVTAEACELHKLFGDMGAFATLQSTPWYNKPTQEGIYEHFKAIAQSSDTKVVLYNIPGRTGVHLEPKTILRLAKNFKNIIAVKDADTDPQRLQKLIYDLSKIRSDFSVLSGEDATLLATLCMGGQGLISVFSNAKPKEVMTLFNCYQNQDMKYAGQIAGKLSTLIETLSCTNNPIAIKSMLALMGFIKPNFRMPLTAMAASELQDFEQKLKSLEWL